MAKGVASEAAPRSDAGAAAEPDPSPAAQRDDPALDADVLAVGDAPASLLNEFHRQMTATLADAVKAAAATQQEVNATALAATAKSVEIIYGADVSPWTRAPASNANPQKDA